MTYQVFQKGVTALVTKSGGGNVRFFMDEHGRFIALCPNGMRIVGRPTSIKVTFNINGHVMMGTL